MSFDECVKFLTFERVDTSKVPVPVGTRGWHADIVCTLSCDRGQSKSQLEIFPIVKSQATLSL